MKSITILNRPEYSEDIQRIQKILIRNNYNANLEQSEKLWQQYSDSMSAAWINLPEDNDKILNCIECFIF